MKTRPFPRLITTCVLLLLAALASWAYDLYVGGHRSGSMLGRFILTARYWQLPPVTKMPAR